MSFIGLIVPGCQTYYQYGLNTHNYETDIPIKNEPPKKSALLFFDNILPDKPFVTGGMITVSGKSSNSPSSKLSNDLSKKAALLGYDAVVDIEKHKQEEETVTILDVIASFSEEEASQSYANFSYLSGIGIKFHENITYLDHYLKRQTAWLIEGNEKTLCYDKTYQTNLKMNKINFHHKSAETYYDNIVEKYDLNLLVNDTNGWEVSFDEQERVKYRRQKRFDDWVIKKLKFVYDKKDRIIQINFIPLDVSQNQPTERIRLEYDHDNNLIKKQVLIDDILWQTETYFHKNNRILKSEIQLSGWKEKKIVIENEYFNTADFPELSENRSLEINSTSR